MKYYVQKGNSLTWYKAIHDDGRGVEVMIGKATRTIRMCGANIEDCEPITQEEFCKQIVIATAWLYEIAGIPVVDQMISKLIIEGRKRSPDAEPL